MLILGIETSCDETAAAVVADGRRVLSSVVATQFEAHAAYGGVVPEIAARRHLENILPVIQGALDQAGVSLPDLDGLAVTQGPGLVGALVIGMAAAKTLAFSHRLPLAGVHHLQAHILAAFLTDAPPAFPFVALVVSGGHTNLYRVTGFLEMELLGRSRDDAAGEAFDKVAKLMQLGYPGGVRIEALAARGNPGAIALPRPRIQSEPLTFSFSGLKTAAALYIKNNPEVLTDPTAQADLAASFQEAVVDSLVSRAWLALDRRPAASAWWSAAGWRPTAICAGSWPAGAPPPAPGCSCRRSPSAATTPPWWRPLGYHLLRAGKRLDLDADVFSRG